MNWNGGSRNRALTKTNKRVQREFFDRKRIEALTKKSEQRKTKRKFIPESPYPFEDDFVASDDIKAIKIASNIAGRDVLRQAPLSTTCAIQTMKKKVNQFLPSRITSPTPELESTIDLSDECFNLKSDSNCSLHSDSSGSKDTSFKLPTRKASNDGPKHSKANSSPAHKPESLRNERVTFSSNSSPSNTKEKREREVNEMAHLTEFVQKTGQVLRRLDNIENQITQLNSHLKPKLEHKEVQVDVEVTEEDVDLKSIQLLYNENEKLKSWITWYSLRTRVIQNDIPQLVFSYLMLLDFYSVVA